MIGTTGAGQFLKNSHKGASGYMADKETCKGTDGSKAFKANMHKACALGIQFSKGKENERGSHSDACKDKIGYKFHAMPPPSLRIPD